MTVVWHHEPRYHVRKVASKRGGIVRLLVLSMMVLIFLGGGVWFYLVGWKEGNLPIIVERNLYLPIGYGAGHGLFYPSVARLVHGIAAADNRSLVTEADYVQAINSIVRWNALADLAKELGVISSEVESDAVITDDIRAFNKMAGWNDDEYQNFVGRQFSLSRAVETALQNNDSYESAAHDRLKAIQDRLTIGIAFPDVAHEYSEDPVTAQSKGSFGYVLPSEVDAVFSSVFTLTPNTNSDVIATDDAYWILRIEDSVTDDSGTRVLLRGIAVRKATLSEILNEKTKNIVPKLFVR